MEKVTFNKNERVVVSDDCSLYTFCKVGEEAEAMKRAEESRDRSIASYKSHIINYPDRKEYWEKCLHEYESKTFKVMSWDEFYKFQRDYYLNGPIKEVTEEIWDDQLNVLPPMAWGTYDGVEEFLISEFYTSTFTNQYAHYNGKYYTKLVDAYDKSTWIHNFVR